MVPWSKLPKDIQKAILALIVVSSGSSLASCCPPVICDPPPPPKTAPPTFTRAPIICDVMPQPSATRRPPVGTTSDPTPPPSVTPRPSIAPPVCDPAPPPAATPRPTVPFDPTVPPNSTPWFTSPWSGWRFQVRSVETTPRGSLQGAVIRGRVLDNQGKPLRGIPVSVQSEDGRNIYPLEMDKADGYFFLQVSQPGTYRVIVGYDQSSVVTLQLKLYDEADVEWTGTPPAPKTPLPLAEIRTVDIVWGDGLTFQVETPWPGAHYRWSVSGGTLVGENEQVSWEPPTEPGRYLLQLVADWGYEGLAVDSLVLTVNRDGSIYIS